MNQKIVQRDQSTVIQSCLSEEAKKLIKLKGLFELEGILESWQFHCTASHRCHWQYWIPLENEQRRAYKSSLPFGTSSPGFGSSPVVINERRQGWPSEGNANFSDPVYILSRLR